MKPQIDGQNAPPRTFFSEMCGRNIFILKQMYNLVVCEIGMDF